MTFESDTDMPPFSASGMFNIPFRMVSIAVVAVLLCTLCNGLPAEAQKLYGDVFTHPAVRKLDTGCSCTLAALTGPLRMFTDRKQSLRPDLLNSPR